MSIVAITGGTGLVGTALCKRLRESGHEVRIFSRGRERIEAGIRYCHWDPVDGVLDLEALFDIEVFVNLAGAGIADKRWTNRYKEELRTSRIDATKLLVSRLKTDAPKFKKLISASAVGYYGADRGAGPFTETDAPGNDFLARLCVDWEVEAKQAESFCSTQIFRFGIAMARRGGALSAMTAPLSFGFMPVPGSGQQIVSWIHLDDLVAVLYRAVEQISWQGTFNLVAPHPVPLRRLLDAYAKAGHHRPIRCSIPPAVLRLALGESAGEVLKSSTMSAGRLLESGYKFKYPTIDSAMEAIVGQKQEKD